MHADQPVRQLAGRRTTSFEGIFNVRSELYDQLSDDDQMEVCLDAGRAIAEIQKRIGFLHTKRADVTVREANIQKLLEQIRCSKLGFSSYRVIENTYNPESPHYWKFPGVVVYSSIGPVILSYRKRVTVIDWKDSLLKDRAEDVFPDYKHTKVEHLVHCWSHDEAVRCLDQLWLRLKNKSFEESFRK